MKIMIIKKKIPQPKNKPFDNLGITSFLFGFVT